MNKILINSILCSIMLLGTHQKMYAQAQKQKNETTMATNVLGTALQACCFDPKTGYFRDGYCKTRLDDVGTHVVCAVVTQEFLTFTKSRGNDLETPAPQYDFPGLKPGDKWCLCVLRWKEALDAGVAPPVVLESTHAVALKYVQLIDLEKHATAP
ncbi:MAG: DUF2237 domain-containing protein [Saprospiraceae bacterium]|nr:DUF2237 domain-containing protein [Saprospiraceae bacterium]